MEYFRATFFFLRTFFSQKNVGVVVISACIYTFDVDIFATAFFTRRELLFFLHKKIWWYVHIQCHKIHIEYKDTSVRPKSTHFCVVIHDANTTSVLCINKEVCKSFVKLMKKCYRRHLYFAIQIFRIKVTQIRVFLLFSSTCTLHC